MNEKVIVTKIQKRFGDIDIFRHVNNVHQQEYFDLGKTDYYRRVLGLEAETANPTLMIVSVKTDFVRQVRFEDEVQVRTWVERIGGKSITIRQQIVCTGDTEESKGDEPHRVSSPSISAAVCSECTSVLVAFDRHAQTTLEVPSGWRERIL